MCYIERQAFTQYRQCQFSPICIASVGDQPVANNPYIFSPVPICTASIGVSLMYAISAFLQEFLGQWICKNSAAPFGAGSAESMIT
jgi:hypothetical protein